MSSDTFRQSRDQRRRIKTGLPDTADVGTHGRCFSTITTKSTRHQFQPPTQATRQPPIRRPSAAGLVAAGTWYETSMSSCMALRGQTVKAQAFKEFNTDIWT